MALSLRLKTDSTIPICVEGVIPERTKLLSLDKISQLPISYGNQQKKLSDCFDLDGNPGDKKIVWQGDMPNVHWVGFEMSEGELFVEGNCGRHLGSQMSGGTIVVDGNVDDYVACENRGGFTRINGNAGNWVGGAYPGTKSGANGGTIIVHGNVGHGCGFAMRRGTICVEGNTGRLTAWNMLAGTILVGGLSGQLTGMGMTRGTVIFSSTEHREQNEKQLPLTFLSGANQNPTFVSVLQLWLHDYECNLEIPKQLRMYHGDQLKGGRGEVFL